MDHQNCAAENDKPVRLLRSSLGPLAPVTVLWQITHGRHTRGNNDVRFRKKKIGRIEEKKEIEEIKEIEEKRESKESKTEEKKEMEEKKGKIGKEEKCKMKKGKMKKRIDPLLGGSVIPYYATSNPEVQIPISSVEQNAELIISPGQVFKGFLDGFANDNLMSYSVKRESSEQLVYHNGDTADAHPFHFHLTSGFASVASPYSSPGLLTAERSYASYLYSRETYGIGPQQTVSFTLSS